MTEETTTRQYGEMVLERKLLYGHAARNNRRHIGARTVHCLIVDQVVGIVEGSKIQPGTYAAKFLQRQQDGDARPVYFSVHPLCGCCSGQQAGLPDPRLTAEHVNCARCR